MRAFANPFLITKAGDFSDDQIQGFWVDLAGESFSGMAKPTSPMPMLILGGKGCGKTHLMRYFSWQLQRIRGRGQLFNQVSEEGFLGIYLRCEGLNSHRFQGKGYKDDVWAAIFEYNIELTLTRLAIEAIQHVKKDSEDEFNEGRICAEFRTLFDTQDIPDFQNLDEIQSFLLLTQKEIDVAVNNCALRKELNIVIRSTRGNLLFGFPAIIRKEVKRFEDVPFLYLIDEFENLSVVQQQYINTLIRERRVGVSFKVGARLYGIRTQLTFSGGEENKEGSEFESLPLDEEFRSNPNYLSFAKKLVARRIFEANPDRFSNEASVLGELEGYFESYSSEEYGLQETLFLVNIASDKRPHFKFLKQNFKDHAKHLDSASVDRIVDALSCPTYPLIEKLNIYLFYQDWYRKKNLQASAKSIQSHCVDFLADSSGSARHREAWGHFKGDLLAQLLRENRRKHTYLGFETFVGMSSGLPRNLLNILKHIFKWANFNNEDIFRQPISVESQVQGVRQAAEWFFSDASTKGPQAPVIQRSIERLAQLFREIRFSNKPAECSPCTFGYERESISHQAAENIKLAEQYSLLIEIPRGHFDKNTMRVDAKYQLNPMLAPLWDLPTGRRGTVSLRPKDIEAIFTDDSEGAFDALVKEYSRRMNVPFADSSSSEDEVTLELL